MSPRRPGRILQLVSRDAPGGVRVLTEMIGAGFQARGFEVETLALIGEGGLASRLAHLSHVGKQLVEGRYRAIFAYHAAAALAMAGLGAMAGVPVRLSHLTAMPEAVMSRWRLLDKVAGASGGYTHVIANSAATASAFSDFPRSYTSRIRLIPHGVVPLGPPEERVDWRLRLEIPAGAPVLVAAGRLSDQKDYGTAVRALPALPGVHLAIAGDGERREALLALADKLGVADRLHLAGVLERSRLSDFLSIGQIYLSPSVWETFGLAAVEAQMAGMPVLASDLPVLREVLCAGNTSLMLQFHPAGDAHTLASTARTMLENAPGEEVRQQVATLARTRYAVATMIEGYLELLDSP